MASPAVILRSTTLHSTESDYFALQDQKLNQAKARRELGKNMFEKLACKIFQILSTLNTHSFVAVVFYRTDFLQCQGKSDYIVGAKIKSEKWLGWGNVIFY